MPDFGSLLHSFATDKLLISVLVLIALDIVLGVAAAVKTKTFSFSRISDFLRDDVLGKVFPWFVLYAADKVVSADYLGINVIAVAAATAYAAVTVALLGSLKDSVTELTQDAPPKPA